MNYKEKLEIIAKRLHKHSGARKPFLVWLNRETESKKESKQSEKS